MTAAFNLSQLANNLNTSGQLDATDGLVGLVANTNLASSGTASSSTFLRGDRTWQPVVQKVLNVVSRNSTITTSNTSTTWVNSDVYATITPSSASSKILVTISTTGLIATGDAISMGVRIMRGGTQILIADAYMNYNVASPQFDRQALELTFLDTPATTSSLTYYLSFRRSSFSGSYGGNCEVNPTGTFGTCTLMEIS